MSFAVTQERIGIGRVFRAAVRRIADETGSDLGPHVHAASNAASEAASRANYALSAAGTAIGGSFQKVAGLGTKIMSNEMIGSNVYALPLAVGLAFVFNNVHIGSVIGSWTELVIETSVGSGACGVVGYEIARMMNGNT